MLCPMMVTCMRMRDAMPLTAAAGSLPAMIMS